MISSTRLFLCSRRCLVRSYSNTAKPKLPFVSYNRTRQTRLCYSTSSNEPSSSSTNTVPGKGSPSPSEPVVEDIVKSKLPPTLTWLPRPLGVRDPPTTHTKTWADAKAELLNREKHLEKRKHLVKQASQGYFHDLNALKAHGGKSWIAPRNLIREDRSLYFPDMTGVALDSGEKTHTTSLALGKISVVAVLSSTISEHHATSFTSTTIEKYAKNDRFRYIQVNLQENILKKFLVSLFMSSLRGTIPKHLQPTYVLSSQSMDYLREDLGMTNKHVGYVYLLDEQCKVRWAGCGFARDEEVEGLEACTAKLLERGGKVKSSSPLDEGEAVGKQRQPVT